MNYYVIYYPEIKLIVAGKNFFNSKFIPKLKRTEYDIYLIRLIEKYDLKRNIEFTGWLNASELIDRLQKTHVFVWTASYSLVSSWH